MRIGPFWIDPVTFFLGPAMAMIVVCFAYALALLVLSRRTPRQDGGRAGPKDVSDMALVFVIPALNEGRVIRASLDKLMSLDHNGPFLVLVVDDGSDDGTAQIVEAYADPRVHLLRRRPPEARQGKGEALNAAYRHLVHSELLHGLDPDKVVVGVVDADGRLDSNVLAEVLPRFADSTVGGAQIGVRINNRTTNWLARMQDFEFVLFNEIFQRARRHLGSVGLGGNGQFVRLSALTSLGPAPWSRSLTEDLDLGIRLIAAGWTNEYAHRVAVHQQGLVRVRRLVRQRTRWFQGHLQAWSLLPTVLRSTTGMRRRDLTFHLIAPLLVLLASLLTVSFLLGLLGRILGAATGEATLLGWWILGVYLLSFLPPALFSWVYWTKERDQGIGPVRTVLLGHSYVFYSLLWFVAGWRASARHVIERTGWAKTARELEPAAAVGVTRAVTPEPSR